MNTGEGTRDKGQEAFGPASIRAAIEALQVGCDSGFLPGRNEDFMTVARAAMDDSGYVLSGREEGVAQWFLLAGMAYALSAHRLEKDRQFCLRCHAEVRWRCQCAAHEPLTVDETAMRPAIAQEANRGPKQDD